jgi:hypothetical protein
MSGPQYLVSACVTQRPLIFKERWADLYAKIRHAAMVDGKSCIPPKRNSSLESPFGGMASSAPYAKIGKPKRALTRVRTVTEALHPSAFLGDGFAPVDFWWDGGHARRGRRF